METTNPQADDTNLNTTNTETPNMTENNASTNIPASSTPAVVSHPERTHIGRIPCKASANAALPAGEYDVYSIQTPGGTRYRVFDAQDKPHTARANTDGSYTICGPWSSPGPRTATTEGGKESVKIDLGGLRTALNDLKALGGDVDSEVAAFTAAIQEKLVLRRQVTEAAKAVQAQAMAQIAAMLAGGLSPEAVAAAIAGLTPVAPAPATEAPTA
jgi:hypothetical protein